jgi:hypothetical protein
MYGQVDITVRFKPDPSLSYQLQWKQIQELEFSHTMKIRPGSSEGIATPLLPGHTYCLRLVCIQSDGTIIGEPSPELVCDTDQVGCTPETKSCCTIS